MTTGTASPPSAGIRNSPPSFPVRANKMTPSWLHAAPSRREGPGFSIDATTCDMPVLTSIRLRTLPVEKPIERLSDDQKGYYRTRE